MKLQISEIEAGVHIGATFLDPVFGVFLMHGDVVRACHGDLVLGVQSIESKGSPASSVLRLDVTGRSEQAVGPVDVAPSLEHGTIVRATFNDQGRLFNVLGPAVVTTLAPMLGVGRWVLAYKGTVAPRLKGLDIIGSSKELGLLCPAPVMSWDDTADE